MKLIQKAILTPDGTILRSSYNHDYQSHTDKNGKYYAIDGGLQSISNASLHGDEINLRLYEDSPYSEILDKLLWGVLENETTKLKFIKDLDYEHLKNILEDYKSNKLDVYSLHLGVIKHYYHKKEPQEIKNKRREDFIKQLYEKIAG